MRFEARDLKPYSEPVTLESLREGEVYFAVVFLDDDGLIPILAPRVFIGRNLEPNDENVLYFQDFDSYRRGIRFESAVSKDEALFETGAELHILEFDHALDVLMSCALKRKRSSATRRDRTAGT
jgi:hypothetical protein